MLISGNYKFRLSLNGTPDKFVVLRIGFYIGLTFGNFHDFKPGKYFLS
jgi:hypothetical protein